MAETPGTIRRSTRFAPLATVVVGAIVGVIASTAPEEAAADAPPADAAATVTSSEGVVAADRPMASRVGARVLEEGGNAADAGVATLLALGVVNPSSSGLGGGGFCLYRPASGDVRVVDFREVAPERATRDMFVEEGEVREEWKVKGGKAVGVPGEAAGLWALTHKYGDLDWERVVEPSRRLARQGFETSSLLAERLEEKGEELADNEGFAETFKRDGEWVDEGETLQRPALADLLERLQDEGVHAFYSDPVAGDIVDSVNGAGGVFRKSDLQTYQLRMRDPVEGTYRGYRVFSMPPASSGGTAIVETLNILKGFDIGGERDADDLHLVVESLKHAFADRAGWLGDTDYVDVPLDRLTSMEYAAEKREMIRREGVLDKEAYGSKAPLPDDSGTSHVSIVDDEQNMISCTSTINLSFGSLVYVPEWGLVLNNEMGDFTAKPGVANNYGLVGTEQNAVAPGKRPLSSMSPTLVLDESGDPYMAVGASGGPTIITGTLFTMLNVVEYGMGPGEAIAAPRIHHQWLPYTLYLEERIPAADRLESFGHDVEVRPAYSNVQMVVQSEDGAWTGVSDPRKDGIPASPESIAADEQTDGD